MADSRDGMFARVRVEVDVPVVVVSAAGQFATLLDLTLGQFTESCLRRGMEALVMGEWKAEDAQEILLSEKVNHVRSGISNRRRVYGETGAYEPEERELEGIHLENGHPWRNVRNDGNG